MDCRITLAELYIKHHMYSKLHDVYLSIVTSLSAISYDKMDVVSSMMWKCQIPSIIIQILTALAKQENSIAISSPGALKYLLHQVGTLTHNPSMWSTQSIDFILRYHHPI